MALSLAALEAGMGGIDLSSAPVSSVTCPPDVLTLWHPLRGVESDLGLDVERVLAERLRDHLVHSEAWVVEPGAEGSGAGGAPGVR